MDRSRYVNSSLVSTSGAPLRMAASMPTPYEGGGHGRRLRGWLAPGTGPNDVATGNAQTLRNRSRSQYRNNGYARSIINKLVSNMVGTGIKPRFTADDKGFQRRAQSLWDVSAREMDPEGLLSIYGLQAQAVNTWLQGGESFIRMRPRRETDGLAVPMQLQVMEPEMCPVHHNGRNGGNRIRAGIEYTPFGQRAAYWFYRSHPGDLASIAINGTDLTRVPANEVIHLFDPTRPGQSRGVPHLAAVLLRMYDTDKYDDAVLLRQQLANLFTAFVTDLKGDGTTFPNQLTGGGDETPAREDDGEPTELGLEPGIIQELGEGEDIKFSTPPDAGSTYSDFLRQQLMAQTAGSDTPYEIVTGDFSKINDRTARVLLNEFRRFVQQKQQTIIVHQLCRVVVSQWWMPRAVLTGALAAPGFARDAEQYTRAKHIPQAWAYINPVQDVQAKREEKRSGFKTQAEIISETTGEDIDDVYARIAAENAEADRLGLVFDTDPRNTDSSGKRVDAAQAQQQEQTEDANA